VEISTDTKTRNGIVMKKTVLLFVDEEDEELTAARKKMLRLCDIQEEGAPEQEAFAVVLGELCRKKRSLNQEVKGKLYGEVALKFDDNESKKDVSIAASFGID